MVKIDTLFKKKRISYISDLEKERYTNFFENSYKDNLEHSKFVIETFPRWSIISGYYAMHDIAKLIIASKHKIKVDFKVHLTTIQLLKELTKNRELTNNLKKGYKEFLNLANDLEEAKKERTKVQYYSGTSFLKEEYKIKAREFNEKIVVPFINKISEMLEDDRVI